MLFWAGIVRHSLSTNQIVRYDVSSWFFFLPLKLKEILCYLCYYPKILLANQFAEYFTFGLFNLFNLIPGSIARLYLFYFFSENLTEGRNRSAQGQDFLWGYPAGIYRLKVNNRNTRTRCEISSKLTIKTPDCSGVFMVNFKHILHLVLVLLLLALNM